MLAHARPLFAALVVSFACATVSGGSFVAVQPQRRGMPQPTALHFPVSGAEVPMHRQYRLPAVDAMIEGQGPYRLILDTGAAGVVLNESIASRLQLQAPPGMPPGMRVQVASPGGAGVAASLVHIKTLSMGDATVEGIWTVAMPLPFGDGLDGVIGMNLFAECLLTFDYPGEQIRLSRGTLPDPDGVDVFAYTPRQSYSHPEIDVHVGDTTRPFLLDTGMAGWFGINKDDLDAVVISHGPVDGMMGLRVDQARRTRVARLETDISIGRHQVQQPRVRVGDENIMGSLFLEHFALTIDGTNQRVRLSRESDLPIEVPSLRVLGLSLRAEGNALIVWDVHPDAPVAELGIAEGDKVLRIDGHPAAKFYESQLWDARLAAASAVTLEIVSGSDAQAPPRMINVPVWELVP